MLNNFFKFKKYYALFTFLLGSNITPAFSEKFPEKILFSDAVKVYSSITDENSLKYNLTRLELFLDKIDLIIDKYADTEIGLELLTKNSYSNFDISKIRQDYLNSLTKFYLKTCELDPSYKCLGFVSLSQANKFCSSNNDLPQLVLASKSLNNSYDIFVNDKETEKFLPAVFNSYRRCVNKTSNQFSKDFIKSNFVQTLLKNGQNSKAIGITEGMKSDIFRIHSAAEIRDYQGKYNSDTFLTLIKRANRLSDEDREISALFLANKLMKNGMDPFKNNVFKYLPNSFSSDTLSCGEKHSYYSDIALDFIFLSNNYKDSRGIKKSNRNLILKDLNDGINKCSNYNTNPINYFLSNGKTEIASKIREFQAKNGINPGEGVIFFDRILSNQEITKYFLDKNNDFEDFLIENKGFNVNELRKVEKNIMYPYIGLAGDYSVFKAFVDNNDTCNASSILFQRLINSNYESPAVLYYISNPLLSKNRNYSCGDAELQLLIN